MSKTAIPIAISLICFLVSSSFAEEPKSYEMRIYEQKKIETMEPSQPKIMESSKPKSLQVSKPKSVKARKSKGLVPIESASGLKKWSWNRENAAYAHCAKLKGFEEQRQCALDALK